MAAPATDSLSGEQIADIAYTLPTLTPRGLSLGIVVASITLAVITTVVVSLRIWVRTGLSRALGRIWKIEDYLLVVGFVSLALLLHHQFVLEMIGTNLGTHCDEIR